MATSGAFNWTTSEGVPPVLVTTEPADGTTGLAIDGSINLFFNELMEAGSTAVTLYPGAVSTTVTCALFVCVVTPSSELSTFTAYNVTFAAGSIQDLAGNSPTEFTLVLNTLGRDTTAPQVLGQDFSEFLRFNLVFMTRLDFRRYVLTEGLLTLCCLLMAKPYLAFIHSIHCHR